MDEIDKAVLLINLLADKEGCRLCSNQANDVYVAEFSDASGKITAYTWPVCHTCRSGIGDMFSEYLPMFCIRCSAAGWLPRSNIVPDNAHAGFVDGCQECTGKREKGWWLGRDGINGNS